MGARIGLRVGGFAAAVACAFLVACGGGGGGGGSVTPPTATPIPTPVLNPTTASTSGALSTSTTTALSLGGISNGAANTVSSASFTMPVVSAAANASVSMTGTPPGGLVAPAARAVKVRAGQASICSTTCTITALAYITLSVSANVNITSSPAFTIVIPSNVTVTTGNAYVVVNINGAWNEVAGPVAASNSMTFPSTPVNPSPFPLTANTNYTFAVITTGSAVIGTPTTAPPSTPTPSPAAATASPSTGPTAGMIAGSGSPLPNISGSTFRTGGQAWSPYDVANALNFPVQNGWDGTGKTIAIIGDVPPSATDLQAFIARWQIPNNPYARYSVVPVTGVTVQTPGSGDIGEATLDVETVMGLAPGATIQFYNTQGDLSNNAFLMAEQQVANANPDVFSISFGGCENYGPQLPPAQATPPDAAIFASMLAKHVAVTVSAGDEGDNCSYSATGTAFGLDYPGSDASVISVGGTETDNGQSFALTSAQVWNDNVFSSGQGAGGGGVSTVFSMPAWQKGISGMYSYAFRNTPDISLPAEGVQLTLNGAQAVFGGTSWSAPQAAALMAELYQYCNARPANPIAELYNGWIANTNNFVDVKTGNNKWNATDSAVTYAAHAGYDNNGGLGVPFGSPLAQSLCPARASWTKARVASAVPQVQLEQLGAARDTVLSYGQRFTQSEDLGERPASETTRATVVLRRTSTMNSDARTVIAALQNAGMDITWSNGALITFTAPSSTIGSYFHTSLHNVSQGKWGMRYSNVGPMTIPASIAPYVGTVLADTLVARKPQHHAFR